MFEKREYKRSPIELAASCGIGEDLRISQKGQISNISLGGICLTLDKNPAVGEKIQLSIDLEMDEDVILLAKVVWTKKNFKSNNYTVGVQIIERIGKHYERFVEFYDSQN